MTENGLKDMDNNIFVGEKPFMNYVNGVMMQFTTKNAGSVIIKARGRYISRAVDIAEVIVRRFLEGKVQYNGVVGGSEAYNNKDGRDVRVSSIEITLKTM